MLAELLKQVKEIGGAFIAPALTAPKAKALEKKKPTLPPEYVQWLKTADGLYWGGLEFFGSQMRQKGGLHITDIFIQNELYRALSGAKDTIILGKNEEELFIYDTKSKCYEIRTEFSNEEIKSFSNLQDMISYLLSEQIELIQNYVAFGEDEAAQVQEEEQ